MYEHFKPCLIVVGVFASIRFWLPHFKNVNDGLRSTKGWGASTSLGTIGRGIEAPIGPHRSVKNMRFCLFCFVFFCLFFFFL